jgi:hypothetical protein
VPASQSYRPPGATCSRWKLGAHQARSSPWRICKRDSRLHCYRSSDERLLRFHCSSLSNVHTAHIEFTFIQVKVLGEKGRHARAAVGTINASIIPAGFSHSLTVSQAFLSFLWVLLLRCRMIHISGYPVSVERCCRLMLLWK